MDATSNKLKRDMRNDLFKLRLVEAFIISAKKKHNFKTIYDYGHIIIYGLRSNYI